jgi:Outer membrane lipoprotein-sorting protein
MNALSAIAVLLLVPLAGAQPADVHSIIDTARQRTEASDFSATGHLVWVQPSGTRVSFPITIKGRWFPGVLRVEAELGSPPKTGTAGHSGAYGTATPALPPGPPTHALIEMRPNGQTTILIAHPGDKSPSPLPFEKWSDSPMGSELSYSDGSPRSAFSYEDFVEEQVFWPGQTSVEETKFGARDCEVVKSTPGPADRTHYSDVKTWFDRTIDFPVYVEKTVKATGKVKEFTAYGLRKDRGVWSAHQIEMKTRGQAGSTLLIIDRGTTKANLTINDFSVAQLTRF